ncbi:MAG TPA: Wzz/FepE/Etk N-terminal domain-containing protein [Candidatus Krumholzibacteria bacterium]|nr:Wzz/FepE/Etk N-terminal domain-containing protein [Candidatus Krumholzibacteria bacterium]
MTQQNRTPQRAAGQQLDAKRLIEIILRRKWLILAIALPIILVATLGTFKTASTVTASAQVMVEPRQPENPMFQQRYVNDDVIMSTAAQIAMSIPVAQRAAVILEDSLKALKMRDPLLAEVRGGDWLVGALIDGVDCGQVGESNVLRLSYTHPSSHFALAAVGALTQAFVRFNIERQQNPSAVSYYSDQIRNVQAEVDSLMALKAQILEAAGYSSYTKIAQNSELQIRGLESEFFKSRSVRQGIEGRLEKLRDTVALNPYYIPDVDRFNSLRNTLEMQTNKLAEDRVRYKDDSVWVTRQQELVAEARRQIDQEIQAYMDELEIELAEARSVENSLRESVDTQIASLSNYPHVSQQVESIDIQVSTRQDLMESLQIKRGEVRLKAGSDQRISSLLLLNTPTLSMRVGGSKKFLYIGVAFVFAFTLGLIVAIFVDNQDHRIYDSRQAAQVLDVPVLGAVSARDRE